MQKLCFKMKINCIFLNFTTVIESLFTKLIVAMRKSSALTESQINVLLHCDHCSRTLKRTVFMYMSRTCFTYESWMQIKNKTTKNSPQMCPVSYDTSKGPFEWFSVHSNNTWPRSAANMSINTESSNNQTSNCKERGENIIVNLWQTHI